MSGEVKHILLPEKHVFLKGNMMVTTPRKTASAEYSGPTPVQDAMPSAGVVAHWGTDNQHPQRVAKDKKKVGLIAAIIEKKVQLLIGGGLRYGRVVLDERTGQEKLIPQRLPHVEQFFRDSNIKLFLREAATDWYTYYNVFAELRMGRGFDRITGIGCQDATHVRLGVMDDKGDINKAYIADWEHCNETEGFVLPALDPYRNVARQILSKHTDRWILPIRHLNDGQFYYGWAPWHALLGNGWLDIIKRIPELKLTLLDGLMNIRYHIEFDTRYWSNRYKDWVRKTEEQQAALMASELQALENFLVKGGNGGAFVSQMLESHVGKDQVSLVKIHELKFTIPEGVYIEDSQEADSIVCIAMGLKQSLIGISASKSGSSPGSGSEDRVARTNHVLDAKDDMDHILESLNIVRDVNGWDPELQFWCANYHAATLDRTNQVDAKPNANPER